MVEAPSEMALATGRDFYEDGVGDEEKLYMPSSSESSFAGDNLDEAEQVAAAQLTTGGSTIVTRSMARRASGAQTGTQEEGSPTVSTSDAEVEAVGDILSICIYLRVAALAIAMPGLTVLQYQVCRR